MLLILAAGCSQKEPPAPPAAPAAAATPPPAADASAGKAIAERTCKACHGLDGRGVGPGIPSLAGQRERYLDVALQEYGQGKRRHPGGQDMVTAFSGPQGRNVAAYYAGLTPPATPAEPKAASLGHDDAQTLAAPCVKCHGEGGNSTRPGVPSLAGQQPYYLIAAMHEFHSGVRADRAMKAVSATADDMQLERLSLYFASQTPVARGTTHGGDPQAGSAISGPCSGCHGADGVSHDSSIPNLAGQDEQYLAKAIRVHQAAGTRWSMEYQVVGLSDQDARNLAAYFAAQTPQAAEKTPASVEAIATQCDRCHDSDNGPVTAPRIKGQDRAYLAIALRAYRDGRREGSAMHNMSSAYSNVAIDRVATFYAGKGGG